MSCSIEDAKYYNSAGEIVIPFIEDYSGPFRYFPICDTMEEEYFFLPNPFSRFAYRLNYPCPYPHNNPWPSEVLLYGCCAVIYFILGYILLQAIAKMFKIDVESLERSASQVDYGEQIWYGFQMQVICWYLLAEYYPEVYMIVTSYTWLAIVVFIYIQYLIIFFRLNTEARFKEFCVYCTFGAYLYYYGILN